jgi:GNAT superfamily N-acetyltransferase
MTSPLFRRADDRDAERIADLHADSWRRHYRGVYADSYLDGDITADRRAVWSARLARPTGTATILAEHEDRLIGFVHVVFDDDPAWGSLVDNLHVIADQHRTGIGTRLLTRAARAVDQQAAGSAMYLWVQRRNTSAQQFYRASGGSCVETAMSSPPGGDWSRLDGTPRKLRMAWPDVTALAARWG